jgi:hypothetical protein
MGKLLIYGGKKKEKRKKERKKPRDRANKNEAIHADCST